MKIANIEVTERIWKDKRIKPETKIIYMYLYTKGLDKLVFNLNIGELQQVVNITNKGLLNNLEVLEKFKYLIYKQYDNGMYMINTLNR